MDDALQNDRPDAVVPDTGPLFIWRKQMRCTCLHEMAGRGCGGYGGDGSDPGPVQTGASRIGDWIDAGSVAGSNAPALVATTEIGELFRQARKSDPNIHPRNAGELAILLNRRPGGKTLRD